MRAAYYGHKCKGEKVRAIFLPLSFSLSLCTHTLAHLPSIFRIGKVGQLHVSYASTFVPTHTHTLVPILNVCTQCVHGIHMFHTVAHMFHCSLYACASTYRTFVSAFSTPPPPLFFSLYLSVIPTRFLAISHYRTSFVCFVSFLVCYEK